MKNIVTKICRINQIIIGLLIITFLAVGCSTNKIVIRNNRNDAAEILKTETEYKYFFVEGIKQKMLGNLGHAVSYFQNARKLNPYSSAAYYELSNIYAISGDYDKAMEYARKAEKIDRENLWFKLHLANLYHITENLDSSIVIYEKIYNKFPDRNDLALNLSELYKEKGDKDKALKIYNELEKKNGISKQLGLAKEELLEKKGEFVLAKNELDKLLKIYKNDINILGVMAELYHNNGYNDKAEEIYNKIFEIEPGNFKAKVSVLGYYRKKKEYTKVFKIINEIIDDKEVNVNEKVQLMLSFISNPGEINDFETNIEILIDKLEDKYPEEYSVKAIAADLCIRTGKLEEARSKLKYIIKTGKANYILWEQLLLIENSMSNYSALFEESGEAIKIFPERPTLYLLKGIAANELNMHSIAVKELKAGLKYVKDNNQVKIQFYSLLADSYRGISMHQESDAAMEKALEIDSENTVILNNYAYYLSERSCCLRKALNMSSKCLEVEPENATYLDTYGWILFKKGKVEKAKVYLEKAMKNAGVNDPEITEHYGDILYELNEYSKAVAIWEDAIILGAEKTRIEKKIKKAKEIKYNEK